MSYTDTSGISLLSILAFKENVQQVTHFSNLISLQNYLQNCVRLLIRSLGRFGNSLIKMPKYQDKSTLFCHIASQIIKSVLKTQF